ncbi:MAG: DUF433 domain-containing protein [Cytophagales bacterium]|nr:DUF433 domain-containing protein [Cytophagales bacterium]
MEKKWLERITLNPEVGHGKPTIRNTRYLVESILEYLSSGNTIEEILSEFNDLQREDILAALAYATEVLKYKGTSYPMSA